ncbi:MAG: phosphorylase, partial [Thermoleophilia bacterium]|nr:phosphorylase [Thermoleophilia bacterium]
HLAPGDLVLVARAVRDEGTSHHYLPDGAPALPDARLAAAIAGELDARELAHHRTATWTTDAIYRETADEVRAHVAAGVDVVEMEAAAVFAVGAVRGAQVASLLVVSDIISTLDGTWVPEFHGEVVGAALERAFDVAVAVLT